MQHAAAVTKPGDEFGILFIEKFYQTWLTRPSTKSGWPKSSVSYNRIWTARAIVPEVRSDR